MNALPQLDNRLYLTDGGLETTLIFHHGLDLPQFAAFPLLRDERGKQVLREYFQSYAAIAREHGAGFVLESPTWRASQDWAELLDIGSEELAQLNRAAIELLAEVRGKEKMVISGSLGPRGDGYRVEQLMSADEAQHYHAAQIAAFHGTAVDMISALTIGYAAEAAGIVRAARAAGFPVAISFTVEVDGTLPSGQPLLEAIEEVDSQTEAWASHYMVNCAHPTHFAHLANREDPRWLRVRGIRANASAKSHAELDEATELDAGDPEQFGQLYAEARQRSPQLSILGGCCGTDQRHIQAVARACAKA